jgi:hypothetical protein
MSSRVKVRIKIYGLGEAEGEFIRVYAPLTVEALMRRLPLEGRAHPIEGGFSILVGLRRGEEKAVRRVEAGTMAYWPMEDSLCVYHSPASPYTPVNRVGRISKGLELLKNVRSRSRVRIERA